jgi:hypothetical protein
VRAGNWAQRGSHLQHVERQATCPAPEPHTFAHRHCGTGRALDHTEATASTAGLATPLATGVWRGAENGTQPDQLMHRHTERQPGALRSSRQESNGATP